MNKSAPYCGQATVCVLEADAGVRTAIMDMVSGGGYHAMAFATPAEFLDSRLPPGPRCLVLDLWLSELTGSELQGELERRGLTIPIVFMMAGGDTIIGLHSTKPGKIHCLVRPFAAENLFAAIEQALSADAATAGF